MEATIGSEAEVPATSIWTRIKVAAKAAVDAVVTASIALGRKVKALIIKAAPAVEATWTRALRPLLRGTLFALAVGLAGVGLVVSPITVVISLAVLGLLFLAAADGVEALEKSAGAGSRAAIFALRAIEFIGRMFVAGGYIIAGTVVVLGCVTAWPYAVFTALLLTLLAFDVRGATTFATLTYCVLTGNLPLAVAWMLLFGRHDLRHLWTRDTVAAPAAETPAAEAPAAEAPAAETPAEPFLHAEGSEEMHGSTHDAAPCMNEECTAPQGVMRTNGLCSACFDAQCEEDALCYTGVSLKARRVEFRLTRVGLEHQPEFATSIADPSRLVWLVSGWFRNQDGVEHPREWSMLDNGDVVGTVRYDHRRREYRATSLGKFLAAPRSLADARSLVQDDVMDARNRVREHTTAADLAEKLGVLFSVAQ